MIVINTNIINYFVVCYCILTIRVLSLHQQLKKTTTL